MKPHLSIVVQVCSLPYRRIPSPGARRFERFEAFRPFPRRLSTLLVTVTLLASPTLRAQIVNDGATNTLSNVTNTITGDVTIGTNGSFTLLVLSDNALLTNSVNGIIGRKYHRQFQ